MANKKVEKIGNTKYGVINIIINQKFQIMVINKLHIIRWLIIIRLII